MVNEPDMRIWEAVMKSLWGTDTKCARDDEREKGSRMVAEAEAKVNALNQTLDERPPQNLDETLYEMTHSERR